MTAATVHRVLAAAAARLRAAGIEDAGREAGLLLREAASPGGAPPGPPVESVMDAAWRRRFERLLGQRCSRRPMAQLLGRRAFWRHDFEVTADTLDPRPDSELLIEAALARAGDRLSPRRVLDLGTGTGCLLLSLLDAWPLAWGVGLDLSAAALAVARRNARGLGLERRAAFLRADWSAPLAGRFEVVVVNPPYIGSRAAGRLQPEVARHEPRLAWDGGRDGLAACRRLLPGLAGLLAGGGTAFLEHGADQRGALLPLVARHGLRVAAMLDDLGGRHRALVLERGHGNACRRACGPGDRRQKALGIRRGVD